MITVAALGTVLIITIFDAVIFIGFMGIRVASYKREQRVLVEQEDVRGEKEATGDKAV